MRWGAVRFASRRLFEILRTIPDIILATILVAAIGVGPLAGVIALTLSTMGSLGKLFTEVNENVDARSFEGVRAAGGSWAHELRFGLAPQVAPNYASYALIRLEVNLAAAAALGIVGAGGIGVELERAISFTQFDTYLAILLLMLVLITSCDLASEAIRRRLTGKDALG
jgi:phosphonate transport system permease protein